MASKREVGAGTVRAWFNGLSADEREALKLTDASVGARGKLSEAVIDGFQKANRGQKYAAKFVEKRKITGKRVSDNGRTQTVTVSDTLPNVRAWAQGDGASVLAGLGLQVGERGRISAGVLSAFAARARV